MRTVVALVLSACVLAVAVRGLEHASHGSRVQHGHGVLSAEHGMATEAALAELAMQAEIAQMVAQADEGPTQDVCEQIYACTWVNGACDPVCMEKHTNEDDNTINPKHQTASGAPVTAVPITVTAVTEDSSFRQLFASRRAERAKIDLEEAELRDTVVDLSELSASTKQKATTHANGWDATTLSYSWEVERSITMPSLPTDHTKLNANEAFFLFFFRPACVANNDHWSTMTYATKSKLHNAVIHKKKADAKKAGDTIRAINGAAKFKTIGDACEAALDGLAVGKDYDFENYARNPAVSNTKTTWQKFCSPDTKVKAVSTISQMAAITSMIDNTKNTLHQEVSDGVYEFCTNGGLTDWDLQKLHLGVQDDIDMGGGQSHIVFTLPSPVSGTSTATLALTHLALRKNILALGMYINDYLTARAYGATASTINTFCHKFLGTTPTANVKEVYDDITVHDVPTYETSDADGARLSAIKFAFLGVRYGVYKKPTGDLKERMGYEYRGGAKGIRIKVNEAVIEALKELGTKAAHIQLPGWRRHKVEDILTVADYGASATWDKRKLGPGSMTDFKKRLTQHAIDTAQFDTDITAFNHYLRYTVVEYSNLPAAYITGGGGTSNLAQACDPQGRAPWGYGTCAEFVGAFEARTSQCFTSAIETLTHYEGTTAKAPKTAELKKLYTAMAAVLHTGVTAGHAIKARPLATDLKEKHVGWGNSALTHIVSQIARPACNLLNTFLSKATNYG